VKNFIDSRGWLVFCIALYVLSVWAAQDLGAWLESWQPVHTYGREGCK
jgi:hypothetical protein